jgi:hypothetical protein
MGKRLSSEQMKEIIEVNETYLGKEKSKDAKGHPYHTFIKDKVFTEKLARKVGCDTRTIDRYFRAFIKYDILKYLKKVDPHGGSLYADGYMYQYKENEKWTKALFFNQRNNQYDMENFNLNPSNY